MKNIKKLEEFLTEGRMNEEEDMQQYRDVFDSIDWDAVGDAINAKIGYDAKLTFNLKKGRRGASVEMKSSNIIERCGIFKNIWDACHIVFFNNYLYINKDDKNSFFGMVSLSYPGNLQTLFDVTVNKKTGKITTSEWLTKSY